MLTAKTGNWFVENPQRARSNNSALLVRSELGRDEWADIMKNVKQFGEPGFVFVDNREFIFNPCVTGDTLVDVKDHGVTIGGNMLSDGVEYQIRMDALVDLFQNSTNPPMVKTMNKETGAIEWKALEGAMLTRKNAELIEIETDCGQVLRCTPDHEIWTKNRGYVEAKDLLETDELVINQR